MLMLQRKQDEWVDIVVPPSDKPTLIAMCVSKFRVGGPADDRVAIGFEAPREVAIHRREIYEAIQRENGDD